MSVGYWTFHVNQTHCEPHHFQSDLCSQNKSKHEKYRSLTVLFIYCLIMMADFVLQIKKNLVRNFIFNIVFPKGYLKVFSFKNIL